MRIEYPGAYLGFCQGGCTFLADLPPPPGSGSGSASRFWAGSGSGSASKQCGSTALGSTVKRLLSMRRDISSFWRWSPWSTPPRLSSSCLLLSQIFPGCSWRYLVTCLLGICVSGAGGVGRHSGAQMSSMVFSLSSMSCLRRLDILYFFFFLLLSGACGPSDLESSEKLTVSSELVEVVRYRPRLAEYLVFFLMIVFLWTWIRSQVVIQIQTWQILKLGEILCFVNTNFLGGQT